MSTYKCKNCGRKYEESDLKDAAKIMTFRWGGKGFCSDRCKIEYSKNHSKERNTETPKNQRIIEKETFVEKAGKSDAEIRADIEKDKISLQLQYEKQLAKEERHENALQRIFDLNGDSIEEISKSLGILVSVAGSSLSVLPDSDSGDSEKYNNSEIIADAALQKAKHLMNILRTKAPFESSKELYLLYGDQLRELTEKQITRRWELKINKEMPGWEWLFGVFFLPVLIIPAYKLVNSRIIFPKKKKAAINSCKELYRNA